MKSYTDLEQSKKLAEILPLESADMYYSHEFVNSAGDYYKINIALDGYFDDEELGSDIPCWSITALLSVLDFPSLTQNKEDEWEVCVFDHDNDNYIEKTASNPVDACYEMIIKLHEMNLL